jgi:hypothetical protein
MMNGKCCKPMKLCPFSLGLALGLTSGLAVIVWTVWAMYYGVMVAMSFRDAAVYAGWMILDGFLFGFVLALLYDLIACCCFKRMKKCDSDCTCACCSGSKK